MPDPVPVEPGKRKFLRLFESLQKTYRRFLKIHGNPQEIALGLALGLFVGMTPFMGLHTAMALLLAALLKWNKLSAAVGVLITNPFTAPIIYTINYIVGAKLMGIPKGFVLHQAEGVKPLLDLLQKTPKLFWALGLGGVVLGLPLAGLGYWLTYSLVSKYQQNLRPKLEKSRERLRRKKELRARRRYKGKPPVEQVAWVDDGDLHTKN